MRNFKDDEGREWTATAREEKTPRHHGRWYLVFHPVAAPDALLAAPEVRWQTAQSAERTLLTMAEFELVRRVRAAQGRAASDLPAAHRA